jgi:hypothetical protein
MHPFGASGLWLAAAISAATTILVGLGQRIDLAKKVLETYKFGGTSKPYAKPKKKKVV